MSANDISPLGKNIVRLRKERNLSREALASAINMHAAQLRRYEIGEATPRKEQIQRIADYFEMRPLDLFIDPDEYQNLYQKVKTHSEIYPPDFVQRVIAAIPKNEIPAEDMTIELNLNNDDHLENTDIVRKQLLISFWDKLNEKGQVKAIEQVEMLTMIPEYKKEDL